MGSQELTYEQRNAIGKELYAIVKKYFSDGTHSTTRYIGVSGSWYGYVAQPESGYFNRSACPDMSADQDSLNSFKKEVRKCLKKHGFTKVQFNVTRGKVHYGYISGPDDFPTIWLNAIYFQ